MGGREEEVCPVLRGVATRCVEEGRADVIVLGSTTMHEAHAFLAGRLPVPVINPGPLSYRLADAAIRLGLGHSKTTYPTPLAPRTAAVAAMGAAVRGR